MKKKLLSLIAIGALAHQLPAQLLYSEKFDGSTTLTSGFSQVPSNMIDIKGDAITSFSASGAPFVGAYASKGWMLATLGGGGIAAISTSKGNSVSGTPVDRWLITPTITGITAATTLNWNGVATAPAGGYQVWVSAAAGASSTPTEADFTAIPANKVLDLVAEQANTVGWATHSISLAAFAGQTVRIGFKNNSTDKDFVILDNLLVVGAKEGAVTSVFAQKYMTAGAQPIIAFFQNLGSVAVGNYTLNYNVDGGTPVTQTFTAAVPFNTAVQTNFTTQANFTTVGLHTVKVWVSDIDGTGADVTASDDTASMNVTVLAAAPPKKVLIEEFTGAWCGYCPDGGWQLNQMTAADTNIIGAAIHQGDNMSTAEGDEFMIGDGINTFPTGTIDRWFAPGAPAINLSPTDWPQVVALRKTLVTPATVSLTKSYNAANRTITATVTATFAGDVKGPFALNCYAVENNVYGPLTITSDNGWNQHSYLFGQGGDPYQGKGLTSAPWSTGVAGLMPTDYVHKHVLTKMMGGAWGDNTVIPTTLITAGTPFTKTFTYVLPPANSAGAHRYNADNIYLIGVIEEYNLGSLLDRYVLNVTEKKLTTNPEMVLAVENIEKADFGTVSVYPNPATTTANIAIDLINNEDVAISVYNVLGQSVYTEKHNDLASGNHLFTLDATNLESGIYNIIITTNKGSISKKVTINK